jgi:hypothetical protein
MADSSDSGDHDLCVGESLQRQVERCLDVAISSLTDDTRIPSCAQNALFRRDLIERLVCEKSDYDVTYFASAIEDGLRSAMSSLDTTDEKKTLRVINANLDALISARLCPIKARYLRMRILRDDQFHEDLVQYLYYVITWNEEDYAEEKENVADGNNTQRDSP